MRYFLIILLLIGLFSCENGQRENKEKANHNDVVDINLGESIRDSINGFKIEEDSVLKENLLGIWASDEYKKILFETNSVTLTESLITHYTDIVFDGKEVLHCNKPSFMENDYLYLKSDSKVFDYNGNLVFTITSINDSVMEIVDSSNSYCRYTKVIKNADLGKIFMEVTKGTKVIEYQWISDNYRIRLDTLVFDVNITENGGVSSDLNIKWISISSYLGKDIIEYRFDNDSTLLYLIKSYSDTLISLVGIENITELDAPIVRNGKNGFMKAKN